MAVDLTFANEVNDDAVNALMERVQQTVESGEQEIRLFLTTYGGELSAAFSFYDRVRLLLRELPYLSFTIIATGYCLSAGTLILQAGTERIAYPHTVFMLHQPSQFPWDEEKSVRHEEVLARLDLQNLLIDMLGDIYARRCQPQGIALDEVETFWRTRFASMGQDYFTPQMALQLGLVDRVERVV
jgi:ATP-dependent protease ClpP protease subunit